MSYCLDKKELECLLLSRLEGEAIESEILESLLDNANQWHNKFLCLTYSFARILERHRGKPLTKKMITELFSMPDELFIDIEECGGDFVNYMLRHEHSGGSDLENSLMSVARRLSEYSYGKETLRD